jgi:hypothetical protein
VLGRVLIPGSFVGNTSLGDEMAPLISSWKLRLSILWEKKKY